MGKVITTWVLDLAESKSGLQDLIADVDKYNSTVAKAAQTAKQGFTESVQAQAKMNQALASGVQQQNIVIKAVDATTAAILASKEAEAKLEGQTSEAAGKLKSDLDANIKLQQVFTEAINATAAAAERSQAGGIQAPAFKQPAASTAPVAPAVAVQGAVPSPSVLAVTQEFERQAAVAKDATVQAQKYLDTVTASAATAKTAAAAANQEAKENKAVYEEDLADLRKLERAAVDLKAALDKAAPGEQWLKANANLERNTQLQAELTVAVNESKDAYESASRAAVNANAELAEQNNLQTQAKVIVRDAAAAEKELAAAQKEAIAAANQQAKATGLIGAAEEKLKTAIDASKQARTVPELTAINKEISALNEEISAYKKLGEQAPQQKSLLGQFFSSVGGQIAGVAAGFFTLNKAFELFTDGLKNSAQIAGIKTSFTALAGSAEGGADEFKYLDDKTRELGLDLVSTANSYKLLFAAGKEAGLGGEQVRDIFSAITAEAKVLGLSNQQVESSLRAVSQMLGKGKVSAEELRRQLGEALPDATAQAAKALGVTTKELDKMLEKGQIISRDFLPKFAAQIQKTYGGATADAATQLQSNLNRISNAYARFTAGLGDLFAPAIAKLATLLEGGEKQQQIADRASAAYERQAAAVADLNKNIPALVAEAENLQKKTSLNADEQDRLKKLLEQITAAIPGAAKGFDAYGKSLGFNKDAVEAFLKSNADLAGRFKDAALRENKALLQQLEDQQKAVIARLNDTQNVDGIARLKYRYSGGGYSGLVPYDTQEQSDKVQTLLQKDNEDLLTRIANLKAKINGTPLTKKTDAEDEVKHLALVLELQKKIADLTDKRANVNDDGITQDNPLGGGVEQINGFTAAIKKYQAELDALLGKEKKVGDNGLLASLKALQAEERKLRSEHEKAVLADLKDAGQARAAEQLRQDFNEAAELERSIKALELAYGKKGGKGANADGKLNVEQQQQVDNLRILAVQKFNDEIARIDREANQKILDLQAESDEKAIAELRAKFAEEIRIAEEANTALGARIEKAAKAGNQTLVLALSASKNASDRLVASLKQAAEEQEKLLLRSQALANIDRTEQAQTNSVNVGQIPIQQYNDPTADGSGAEQAGATKRISLARSIYEKLFTLETDLEAKKQKALLQIQIDGNNARLAQYADDFTKEGVAIKDGLETANKGLYDQLNAIKEPKREFNLAKLLGVDKDHQDEVNKAFSDFLGNVTDQLNTYLQEEVDATTKVVDQRKADVEEKQKDLDTEIELNKQGFASNVETKRAELAEAKNARAQAIQDQKAALKAQQTVQTIEQTVSLITASASILQGFSAIPIIGLPLGIAAVAAMFGFFVAAKAKAASASAKLEKGGWIGGKRHAEGGNKFVSTDGQLMEHEEGEFAVNRKSARKYADIIEALNADDEKSFATLALKHLLKGTGVIMSVEAPKRLETRKSDLAEAMQQAASRTDTARLDRMEGYLASIKENTKPAATVREYSDRREIQEGNRTRIIRKK